VVEWWWRSNTEGPIDKCKWLSGCGMITQNGNNDMCKWLSGCGVIIQNGNDDMCNGRVVVAYSNNTECK
jgi:hypothetical protein